VIKTCREILASYFNIVINLMVRGSRKRALPSNLWIWIFEVLRRAKDRRTGRPTSLGLFEVRSLWWVLIRKVFKLFIINSNCMGLFWRSSWHMFSFLINFCVSSWIEKSLSSSWKHQISHILNNAKCVITVHFKIFEAFLVFSSCLILDCYLHMIND